jgi:hypothetical protein
MGEFHWGESSMWEGVDWLRKQNRKQRLAE